MIPAALAPPLRWLECACVRLLAGFAIAALAVVGAAGPTTQPAVRADVPVTVDARVATTDSGTSVAEPSPSGDLSAEAPTEATSALGAASAGATVRLVSEQVDGLVGDRAPPAGPRRV